MSALRGSVYAGLFAMALVVAGTTASLAAPASEEASLDRTDLTGVILDEVGQPVSGAHIFIESARPRKGVSSICPSCYPDCRKRAQTDAKGEFKLLELDESLLFRLMIVAKGYEAAAKDKADPILSPLSIALWKRPPLEENQRLINARVYDSAGKPTAGAFLEVEGAETSRMTTWGGHKQYIQTIGVTDDDGVMTLVGSTELKAGLGILQAPGYAKQWVRVSPGKDQLFLLHEGVFVNGQVQRGGKAVAGLRIGFSGADRSAGEFMQGWEVDTDAQGRFSFVSVTPGKDFNIYSMAKSGAKLGVLPARPFHTGPDKSKLDLGTIELQAPLHLRGRLLAENGEPFLAASRILLGREQAWDYQETDIDEEGHFEFTGLGPEQVGISLRLQGYKFSKKNPNRVNSRSLEGLLKGNLEDFIIIVEETDRRDDPNNHDDDNWQARETPLRSAVK